MKEIYIANKQKEYDEFHRGFEKFSLSFRRNGKENNSSSSLSIPFRNVCQLNPNLCEASIRARKYNEQLTMDCK